MISEVEEAHSNKNLVIPVLPVLCIRLDIRPTGFGLHNRYEHLKKFCFVSKTKLLI